MDGALPPLTAAGALSHWRLDPAMLALATALLVGHLVLVRRAGARGHRWPVWRTLAFAVLGPGTLVVATTSFLAVYREVLFWPAATANTVLLTVTPMGLALGAPLRLARSVLPPRAVGADAPRRRWTMVALRVVATPLVGALLGLLVQFLVYFTPWFAASLRSGVVRTLTWVVLLAAGTLFTVPLLDEGAAAGDGAGVAGPDGAGWGARVLLAFGDGLVDAVPGMVVALSGAVVAGGWYVMRTPSWWGPGTAYDQLLGGELMVGVAEAVGVPLILAACIAWSRADTARAVVLDAALDAAEQPSRAPASEVGEDALSPGTVRPWWETEGGPWDQRRR